MFMEIRNGIPEKMSMTFDFKLLGRAITKAITTYIACSAVHSATISQWTCSKKTCVPCSLVSIPDKFISADTVLAVNVCSGSIWTGFRTSHSIRLNAKITPKKIRHIGALRSGARTWRTDFSWCFLLRYYRMPSRYAAISVRIGIK